MSEQIITVARIYSLEGKDNLNKLLDILHDQEKVAGVTVLRGIAGYGESGKIHTSTLLTLSLELPLVVEFFDQPEKVSRVIEKLKNKLDVKHIVSWTALSHVDDE